MLSRRTLAMRNGQSLSSPCETAISIFIKKEHCIVEKQKQQEISLMNRLRRVINNTAISLLGQIVTWISTMLLTIAFVRFLGDVKLGELFLAITYVSLIGFPIEFCFNQQITRDIAQYPDKALKY